MKRKRSFTLSDYAVRLLAATAAKLGISMTAVLEISIREKAQREQVVIAED